MGRWLTRNVFAIGMLSLFSDMGHELATSVLPLFLATFGGGAVALGVLEGFSDFASSILKLWMSFHSDKVGKRKPIILIGYIATAIVGTFGFVQNWWQLVVIRVLAWMGKGARGPVRDALLAESVPVEAHGRAFGFHRAMDTLGAIIGPAIALALVGVWPLRSIFLVSFIPGAITVLIVVFLIKEVPLKPQPHLKFFASIRNLPPSFWRYVTAVGVFGLGNFGHTLLVFKVVTSLSPTYGAARAGQIGLTMYILHNIVNASVSYPIGVLADRFSKTTLLAIGYALFGVMCLGFLGVGTSIVGLGALFVLAGIYLAVVETVERALAAGLLPAESKATGFGVLATVNSFGDLGSSVIVGLLFAHVSFAAGFTYGAILTLLGSAALFLWFHGNKPKLNETITSA
jgi:MFS family permease